MQLTEKILELIYAETAAIPYITDRYDVFCPDEAVYPFISYNEISTKAYYEFTPRTYNNIVIQFSIFDNQQSPNRLELIKQHLECMFHYNTSLKFTGQTSNYKFICSHKISETPAVKVKDNDKDVYWMTTVDYVFTAVRSSGGIP